MTVLGRRTREKKTKKPRIAPIPDELREELYPILIQFAGDINNAKPDLIRKMNKLNSNIEWKRIYRCLYDEQKLMRIYATTDSKDIFVHIPVKRSKNEMAAALK